MRRKVDFSGTPEQLTICEQLIAERSEQDRQWGGPVTDDGLTRHEWLSKIQEHATRARKIIGSRQQKIDLDEYRRRLVVTAALAMAAIEAHDRDMKADR
jgi:hypothetical protein